MTKKGQAWFRRMLRSAQTAGSRVLYEAPMIDEAKKARKKMKELIKNEKFRRGMKALALPNPETEYGRRLIGGAGQKGHNHGWEIRYYQFMDLFSSLATVISSLESDLGSLKEAKKSGVARDIKYLERNIRYFKRKRKEYVYIIEKLIEEKEEKEISLDEFAP